MIDFIANGESGLSVRNKLNTGIDQLNSLWSGTNSGTYFGPLIGATLIAKANNTTTSGLSGAGNTSFDFGFTETSVNIDGGYDTTNRYFVAPYSGTYYFQMQMRIQSTPSGRYIIFPQINDTTVALNDKYLLENVNSTFEFSSMETLNSGDTLKYRLFKQTTGTLTIRSGVAESFFQAHFLGSEPSSASSSSGVSLRNVGLILPLDEVAGDRLSWNASQQFVDNNGVSSVDGLFSKRASFLGSNDSYLSFDFAGRDDISRYQFGTGSFSIAAWVRVPSTPTGAATYILSLGDGGAGNSWINLSINGSRYFGSFLDDGSNVRSTRVPVDLSTDLHHLVMIANRENQSTEYYIDSTFYTGQDISTVGSVTPNNSDFFTIGARRELTDHYDFDDIEIEQIIAMRRIITSGEVSTLYGNGNGLYDPFY